MPAMSREMLDISGYSSAQRLALFQDLLASPVVDKHRNLDIIETTPLAQNYPYEESLRRLLVVSRTGESLPEIRPLVLEVASRVLRLQEKEPQSIDVLIENLRSSPNPRETTTNALYVIETLLKSPDTFGFPKEQFRLATVHIGTLLAAKLYKSETDEELKASWLSHVHYFAALECLYSGIKTNSTLFAIYPEQVEVGLLDGLSALIYLPGEKEAKTAHTRSLFEGHSVSPIKHLGGGKLYFSLGKPRE